MVTPTPKRIWVAQTAKHPWCRSSAPRTKRKDASMSFFVELLRGDLVIHEFCMIISILSYLMYSQSQNENEAMKSLCLKSESINRTVRTNFIQFPSWQTFLYQPSWQRKTWVTPTCPSDLPSCWSYPVSFEVSWLIQSTRHGGETKKHPWGSSQNLAWCDWCGYKHEKSKFANLLRNMRLLPTMYPASLANKSSWVLPGRIFTRSWCGGVM